MMDGNGLSILLSRAAPSASFTSVPALVRYSYQDHSHDTNKATTGNFTRDEAAAFLGGFAEVLTPTDSMIVAVDSCSNPSSV